MCPGGKSYLIKTIPTEAEKHTAQFLADTVIPVIKAIENSFQRQVIEPVVTTKAQVSSGRSLDQRREYEKMRAIVHDQHPTILQLGCAIHQHNLLVHDL